MTSQWTDDQQRRLDALREREDAGRLTEAEQIELQGLVVLLDDLEAQQLRPALDRLRRENDAALEAISRLEQTQGELTDLATRQRRLIIRARGQLQELLAEHRILQADYRRLNIAGGGG